MSQIIQPMGTFFCDYPSRVPSQTDGNCHLNVDESIALYDDADYVTANGTLQAFALLLPQTSYTGQLESIKVHIRLDGDQVTIIPGAIFVINLDGVACVDSKQYRLLTNTPSTQTFTITWTSDEFTNPSLTGLLWNAAAERVLWITTFDAGVVDDEPPPYQE